MKPSRPKEEREQDQINRGLAAERLISDDVVTAWFADEERRLIADMLTADLSDDGTRRDCAMQIRVVRNLKSYLQTEATFGRKQMEKAKANG